MAAVWLHTVKWAIFAMKVKQMEAFLWVIPLSRYLRRCPALGISCFEHLFTHREAASVAAGCSFKREILIHDSRSATKTENSDSEKRFNYIVKSFFFFFIHKKKVGNERRMKRSSRARIYGSFIKSITSFVARGRRGKVFRMLEVSFFSVGRFFFVSSSSSDDD